MHGRSAISLVCSMLLVALATARASAQQIIYVSAASGQIGDGTSWASAHDNLQFALTQAAAVPAQGRNVEVWVAGGVYKPGGAPTSTFNLLSGIKIRGGFSGFETTPEQRAPFGASVPSILSGDIAGNDGPAFSNRTENVLSVVTASGCDRTAVLEGFVIQSGGATAAAGSKGGGIRITAASPTIRECRLVSNLAEAGAGSSVRGASAPLFERCLWAGNYASVRGAAFESDVGCAGTYVNCIFSGNAAGTDGGAFANEFSASTTFINCTITQNTAQFGGFAGGGGLSSGVDAIVNLRNCIVFSNMGVVPGAGQNAYFADRSQLICANTALEGGPAGVFLRNSATVSFPAGNTAGNPLLTGTTGLDSVLGTVDDLPTPQAGAAAADSGSNGFVNNDGLIIDYRGRRRIADADQNGTFVVDMGAVEIGAGVYTPILYVNAGLASGTGDGSTWGNAFRGAGGLQVALGLVEASAGAFTQVWVAGGTYKPSPPLNQGGSRATSFELRNNLALYGGFAGNEGQLSQRNLAANQTVLSGDLNGDDNGDLNLNDNTYHVVYAGSGVAPSAVLDGFTVTAGNANGTPASNDHEGGGLNSVGANTPGSAPTIRLCRFLSNRATYGAAIHAREGNYAGPPILIDRCEFTGNIATNNGGALAFHRGVKLNVRGCTFTDNLARGISDGSVAPAGGGAVCMRTLVTRCAVEFVDCMFLRNRSEVRGGAMEFAAGQEGIGNDITLQNCRFLGNTASQGAAAIWVQAFNDFRAEGSLFVGNTVIGPSTPSMTAGAIFAMNCPIRVTNCTLAFNSALGISGGLGISTTFLVVVDNCVLWGNSHDPSFPAENAQCAIYSSTAIPRFNIWQNLTSPAYLAGQSVPTDPRFLRLPSPGPDTVWGTTDDDYGDLRLSPGSPAIDSGDSLALPLDTLDIDNDGNFTENLPLDLSGFPRFVDDPAAVNSGPGSAPHVDRGAYESQVNCLTCPGPREWRSPIGGTFDFPSNWFPSVPNATHDTLYNLNASYTVALPTGTTQSRSAAVERGSVTWALPAAAIYSLGATIDPALVVGGSSPLPASLTITGGRVNAANVPIGLNAGSNGELALTGSGTLLNVTGNLTVGFEGTGSLVLSNGARLLSRDADIGRTPGARGDVLLSGVGTRWDVRLFMAIDHGRVTVRDGATLATSIGAIFILDDGVLDGNGTIIGDVINLGAVEPGNSPGTLTINGNYQQVGADPVFGDAGGRLTMQVEGTGTNQFDRLVVTGQTQLGGGLIVESPATGFPTPPPEGLSLPLIDALGGIGVSDTTGMPADHFDVAFFPRVPAAGGGPSDRFLRLERPEGAGAQFFNLTTGTLGVPINVNDPSNTSATSTPSSVTSGDLDGDGLADLVLTTPSNNSAVILMNRGTITGEWQGFEGAVQFAVGSNPQGARIFDIDQDGLPDISVANAGSNSVTLFKNNTVFNSHAVALANQGSLATGATPMGIDINHFDGSGTRPVIITTDEADGSISILIRTGTPGFNFTPRTSKPVPVATPPRQPRNLDIDGDGAHPDLALLSASGSAVLILQNISMGTGIVAFADAVTLPVDAGPAQLEVAALRDGRSSLVTANSVGNTLSVLVNTADVANPVRFAPAVNIPAGTGPLSLAALDVDADTDADLAVLTDTGTGANPLKVRLLRNDYLVAGVQQNDQVTFVNDRDLPDEGAPTGALFVIAARLASPTVTDLLTVNSQGGGRGPGEMALNVRPRLNATMGGGVNTCFTDFNNDGIVSPDDLDEFITTYFSEPPDNATADFNDDGIVSPDDLDEFITAYFGGC